MKETIKANNTTNTTILLKIKDETFLLESTQELDMNIINEIEILCHSANDEESEFNIIKSKEGFNEELFELNSFDIAEIFQKVVLEYLNIKVIFKPINLEVKIWL